MDDHLRLTRLRALAHPARLQILSLLTGTAMSAAEVARELDTTQANASYHLRRLVDSGDVVLAEEVAIRGGRAKRYRCVPVGAPDDHSGVVERAGDPAEAAFYATVADELRRRARGRATGQRATNADAELWVTPEVWDDVVGRVAAAVNDLHAAAVAPRSPGTLRTSTTVALFTMAPQARHHGPEDDA